MTRLAYSYETAAEATSISVDVIRAAVRTKALPAFVMPGTKTAPRIRHEDLMAWLATAKPYEPAHRSPRT